MAHDSKCKQGYDNNGGGTHGSVIVVAAFAVVLVSVILVGIAVALRVVGVGYVLDVLGESLDPVVRHRQIIKWTAGGVC